MERRITAADLSAFEAHLREAEMAAGTIENYLRHARAFLAFAGDRAVTKELTLEWKETLRQKDYAPSTVNAMLVSLNGLFTFLGWTELKLKLLRLQRQLFRDQAKELTREEYERLVSAARAAGKERLALLMETICATGIRVSEVRYITVEAAERGMAEISLKGKIRTILMPGKLRKKLLKYAKRNGIRRGEIFRTAGGKPLSRRQIWGEMKAVCRAAEVEPSKVFPHNLRHLFARTFYRIYRDVAHLADVLGHSSIETTRIYLLSTGDEHRRQLERLGLVT